MLVNPITKKQIDSYVKNPSHGLIIYGSNGAGKQFLARYLACKFLSVDDDRLDYNLNFIQIDSGIKKSIGIDVVRQLKSDAKLKSTSDQIVKKVILIVNAEKLTQESQNALLKILEEPNEGTLIILTVQNQTLILPTIKSRVQSITVQPVSLNDSFSHFKNSEPHDIEKYWLISGGLVGLMSSLVRGDENHELLKSIEQSKKLITMPVYERLLMINDLTGYNSNPELLFEGLDKVLAATHHANANIDRLERAKRILQSRIALQKAVERHNKGENIKLNLLELFVSL